MKKRVLSTILAFIMVFSMSTTSFANSGSRYQVNTPKKEAISTTKNRVLISGKAPRNTRVSIDVYGAADIRGKNYNLANLPKNKDYVLISRQNIRAGAAGFGEEVKLIKGINKIIVTFKVDGVKPVQKIIYCYDAQELRRLR